MKERQTALILIGCAILLALGSYFLLTKPAEEERSVHKAAVTPPPEEPAKAPDWVKKGQEAKPDYKPSETKPEEQKEEKEVPVIEEKTPQVIEITEDKMVTFTFVEALADFFLHRYIPQNAKGKPDSLANPIALNKYFGRELDGFAVSVDNINASRKAVLDYAFTPGMIRTLYDLYAQAFMIHLVDTAQTDAREYSVGDSKEVRTLTKEETASMLRLNSRRIERMAILFRAFADDPGLTELAGKYRRSAKAVGRANEKLQIAIADEKDTSQAGERLKQAILQRERVRAEIITKLKQSCHACEESELFYMSQWAYRRVLDDDGEKLKTFGVVADVLDDLSQRFENTANELK